MTDGLRSWGSRLFLWLALAAVLVPALGSTGSPLRPGQGSAFSAFTRDVSLGPGRAAPPEKERKEHRDPATSGAGAIQMPASTPLPSPPAPDRFVAAAAFDMGLLPAHVAAGAVGARAPPLPRTL